MMNPKVSVCMVTYKHGAFITEAIESVLHQQTNFFFDLVIGIDYPFDDAIHIVKKYGALYPEKITVIMRQNNVGAGFNLIDTCEHATGEYIAILDGDDIMRPTRLQKQVDYLDQNLDVVMVGHAMRVFDHESRRTIKIEKPWKFKKKYTIEDFLQKGSFLSNSSKMFRRAKWPLDLKNYPIKHLADYYFTLHVVKDAHAAYLSEVLGEYRMHGKNLTKIMRGAEIHKDLEITLKSVSDKYHEKYNYLFGHITAYGKLMHGICEIRNGNLKNGRRLLLGCLVAKWNIAKSLYYYLFLSFLPNFITRFLFQKS